MAVFPVSTILDSGTGSNANPAGGSWTSPFYSDAGSVQRSSNTLKGTNASGAFNGGYWNANTYSIPCGASYTLNPLPGSGDTVWVDLAKGTLSAPDGYGLTYQHGTSGARPFQLYRLTGGAQTRLSPAAHTIAAPLGAGDAIGIYVDGSGGWQAWYRASGTWTLDHSGTDTTYTGPFNPALELENTAAAVVNFVAGGPDATVVPPALESEPIVYLGLGDTAALSAGIRINPYGRYEIKPNPASKTPVYTGAVSAIATTSLSVGIVEVSASGGSGGGRVECATQPWGIALDQAGNTRSGLAVTLTDAATGGHAILYDGSGNPIVSPATDGNGGIPGFVDGGSYAVTLTDPRGQTVTHTIQAISGSGGGIGGQSSTANEPATSVCVGTDVSSVIVEANPDRLELIISNMAQPGSQT